MFVVLLVVVFYKSIWFHLLGGCLKKLTITLKIERNHLYNKKQIIYGKNTINICMTQDSLEREVKDARYPCLLVFPTSL